MKKLLLLAIIAMGFTATASAQTEDQTSSTGAGYSNAIGIRLSSSVPAIKSGISYKHFFGNNAIEGILSFGEGVGLGGLYEIHKPVPVENLQWLYGFGGYVSFDNSSTHAGALGIIGLDYKFAELPLNITLDWKPELNIVSQIGFEGSGVGLSARFTF